MRLTGVVAPTILPYRRQWLGKDVVAGLVLTALLVPQGMAYAELAGLPAVTGLYTSIIFLTGYALMGPSKVLVLGPASALGPMIAATILPLVGADGDPERAVLLASALAILVGLLMLGAADPRPDWIVVAAESISDVDTTACDMVDCLDADGTRLVFAEMKGTVLAKLRSFGPEHLAGDDRFPPTLDAALAAYLALHPADTGRASDQESE